MTLIRITAVVLAIAAGFLLPPGPANAQEYVIGTGDVLDISVLGEPAVTGAQTVASDGVIMMPMAGRIPLAGLTLSQATAKVTEALKAYIRDPQVSISIRQAAPRRQYAYVLGQVAKPGAYELQNKASVAELVAIAGGPVAGAALSHAVIVRKDASIPVDLEKLLIQGDASANVPLESGDLVIVPETTSKVVLMGQVTKPGPYAIKPGDRLVDVLSVAGGPAQTADTKQIGVIRQPAPGQKPVVTPVDLNKFYKDGDMSQNLALEPGDVIYVPEKAKTLDWTTILSTLVFPVLWLVK